MSDKSEEVSMPLADGITECQRRFTDHGWRLERLGKYASKWVHDIYGEFIFPKADTLLVMDSWLKGYSDGRKQ